MPIFIRFDKIVHFAHIPKAGGTTIEQYILSNSEAKYAFIDGNYIVSPSQFQWNQSSPQHVDGRALSRLFPVNFFTDFFTVLRDPLDKFISAFLFQRKEPLSRIKSIEVNEFVEKHLVEGIRVNGWCDNHFLPQHMFLYPGGQYNAFLLSNHGMMEAKIYIDSLFEIQDKANQLPHFLKSDSRETLSIKQSLTSKSISILKEIYQKDYELLGSFSNFRSKIN